MSPRSIMKRKKVYSDLSMIPQPIIEVCGDGRVLIEHHKGVCSFGSDEIEVRVAYGSVRVCGNNLHIHCMDLYHIVIRGGIEGVTLCKRKGYANG